MNFPSESAFSQTHDLEQLQLFPTNELQKEAQAPSTTTTNVVTDLIEEALRILEDDGDPIEVERLLREAVSELG